VEWFFNLLRHGKETVFESTFSLPLKIQKAVTVSLSRVLCILHLMAITYLPLFYYYSYDITVTYLIIFFCKIARYP